MALRRKNYSSEKLANNGIGANESGFKLAKECINLSDFRQRQIPSRHNKTPFSLLTDVLGNQRGKFKSLTQG